MDSKMLRIIVGIIWIVVAIISYTRNDMTFAIISAILAILFFVFAFKDDNSSITRS